MGKSKKELDRYYEKRKEMKKLSMRKAREKMRSDPVKHEEAKAKDRERYKKKKEEGKIKLIGDISNRDKRLVRKEWKKRSAKYRSRKRHEVNMANYIETNTPPSSPELHQEVVEPSTSRQQDSGKKQARKNRERKNKMIKELEAKLKKANSKVNKYKKRLSRMKSASDNKDTPRKNVARIVREFKKSVTPEIKKKLLFAEVISKQIRENYKVQKNNKGKRNLAEAVTGKVIEKYRFTEYLASLTSAGSLRRKRYFRRVYLSREIEEAKKEVCKFLAKDESSRLTAGKRETLTRKKVKKQKRLMNDSLKNLHKKFITEHPRFKNISYSLFCKFRPFWIVPPNAANRNTCLCKVHDNMKLLTARIIHHKIIEQTSVSDLVHSLCCKGEFTKEDCLERKCTKCINKVVNANEFDPDELTFFEEWKNIKVPVIVKGKEKICNKVVKVKSQCTKGELLSRLKTQINPFMQHLSDIKHQFKAVSDIKKNLGTDDVLLQFDFSENYNCKYTEEIQSAHFGGSKPQITLHTSVCYYKSNTNELAHKSFCTVSKSTRHDPAAVTAHLDCVLDKIKATLVSGFKKVHFVSDGPSTQYRNKTMFHLLVNHIAPRMKCEECTWNYCEAGHGKGSPDGVGGYLKRTADGLVATGTDIPDFETFVSELKAVSTKVDILTVDEKDINMIDTILPKKEDIAPFKGTMKIHQISWSVESSSLQARRLSCIECQPHIDCAHYGIGSITFSTENYSEPVVEAKQNNENRPGTSENLPEKMAKKSPSQHTKLRYTDVYSDSSDEDEKNQTTKVNDFVIAKIPSTKNTVHLYIGVILKKFNDELLVKFLKKSTTNLFVFPEKEDISHVELKDIVKILKPPNVNNRGQYRFEDIMKFNIST